MKLARTNCVIRNENTHLPSFNVAVWNSKAVMHFPAIQALTEKMCEMFKSVFSASPADRRDINQILHFFFNHCKFNMAIMCSTVPTNYYSLNCIEVFAGLHAVVNKNDGCVLK